MNQNRGKFVAWLGVAMGFALLGPSCAVADTFNPVAHQAEAEFAAANAHGQYRYLIEFAEPGVLRQSARAPGERLDWQAARPAREALMARQAEHRRAIGNALGRSPDVSHHYLVTHSGMAVWLAPGEAETVRRLEAVVSVERERQYELATYRGPAFIGADTMWDGSSTPDNSELLGEGMVIGVLDTGIAPAHPAFANVAACGHGGANPDKLLSFLDCASTDGSGLCNGPSPADTNGHGTHVASTAAGNVLDGTATPAPNPPAPFDEISGVAPCAHIRAYKVCPADTCPQANAQAGMDSILIHGDVDVMNFSISGGTDPWLDNDRKKLDLVDAGVFAAASAGNTSTSMPDPVGNVNHRGPWVLSVANSTHDENVIPLLWAGGPGTPPAGTQNISLTPGSTTPVGGALNDFPIRRFGAQPENAEGCTPGQDGAPGNMDPFPADFFDNAAALIRRGTCPFTVKIANAFNAGAEFVLIANHLPGAISMDTTGAPAVPAYSLLLNPGIALIDFVEAHPGAATIDFDPDGRQGDILSAGSLRGPTPAPLRHLTKPDITAPGTSIYAAVPGGYANISGTSMSSPHAAGAAVLVRQAHPDWTPSEVKSALMTTARKTGFKDDGSSDWDWDDVGSGRVDLTKAALAGLVMDESFANYLAANPGEGGDVRTLNTPSLRNLDCIPECTWTRTVRNTLDVATEWTISGNADGFDVDVAPASFNFSGNPTETQTLTITATPVGDQTQTITFGEIVLTETGALAPDQHLTLAVRGHDGPSIDVAPDSFTVALEADQTTQETLTIANVGGQTLNWTLDFAATGQAAHLMGDTVIWEQTQTGGTGILSDFFNPLGAGIYSADDFVAATGVNISTILTPGFRNAGPLGDITTQVSWFIFPDNGGIPGGDPETSPGNAVWSHTAAPTGAGVSLAGNGIFLDVVAATGDTLELPSGHYWLSVFPHINADTSDGGQRWNWFAGTPAQAHNARIISPQFTNFPVWTDISAEVNPVFAGLAFTLTGTLHLDCQSTPPSWLAVDLTGSSIDPGDPADEVTLTFDTAGLSEGEYSTILCLESNDPLDPLLIVPVALTVLGPVPVADLSPLSFTFELEAGQADSQALHVGNTGAANLIWNIETAEPAADAVTTWKAAGDIPLTDTLVSGAGGVPTGISHWMPRGGVQMSQTGDTNISGTSAACPTGPNHLMRRFYFDEHPEIGAAAVINSVDIAIQEGVTTQTLTVNLYTLPSSTPVDTIPVGSLTLIGSGSVTISSADDFSMVNVPVHGVVSDTEALDLVIEATVAGEFFIGATNTGETHPGFIMAPACGLASPTPVVSIGPDFQNVHIIMVVNAGDATGCDIPGAIPWLSVAPAGGITPPEDSVPVSIAVDTNGLGAGAHHALLCVHTNDEASARVEIPVNVTVTSAPPVNEVFEDRFEVE